MLSVCYPSDTFSQISQISDFIPPISNIIPSCIMNQSSTVVENQINDALHKLSKDLYPFIRTMVLNFDVPTRTLQKKITRVNPLSNRSPNNKAFSDAQEQAICEYIERLNL